MRTDERRALTRFNDTLRAYCRLRGDCLVQLGKNRYCLLESGVSHEREERVEPIDERPRLPLRVTIRITRLPPVVAQESPVSRFRAWLAPLRPALLRSTPAERRRAAFVAQPVSPVAWFWGWLTRLLRPALRLTPAERRRAALVARLR
jgi:hypothetical protein